MPSIVSQFWCRTFDYVQQVLTRSCVVLGAVGKKRFTSPAKLGWSPRLPEARKLRAHSDGLPWWLSGEVARPGTSASLTSTAPHTNNSVQFALTCSEITQRTFKHSPYTPSTKTSTCRTFTTAPVRGWPPALTCSEIRQGTLKHSHISAGQNSAPFGHTCSGNTAHTQKHCTSPWHERTGHQGGSTYASANPDRRPL
ncbi:hypothetical protein C7212DRAFT_366752 [Tuber magnatum]|uniref:Uncharacterized protein n=1 Tax=Tuber magnatum TaxID=42249 RepID=A0A317SCX8_9PEZI|nr:hypothetical protein C7212DRAFT_366752 [Tuber magnatum]